MTTDLHRPARPLLGVFLNDHLAVAAGGRALARRGAAAVAPSPHRDALMGAAALLGEQAAGFRGLLQRHGLREQRGKRWLAVAGERAGRLKLNGRLVRPSPLSRLVELEGVLLSLAACRLAWRALGEAGIAHDEAGAAVDALDRQTAALDALAAPVARRALTG